MTGHRPRWGLDPFHVKINEGCVACPEPVRPSEGRLRCGYITSIEVGCVKLLFHVEMFLEGLGFLQKPGHYFAVNGPTPVYVSSRDRNI
jgi:hypothetical protein